MKLNLLPTTVTRQRKAKSAWVVSILMILVGVAGAAFMIISSGDALSKAKAEVDEKRPQAEAVAATAASADEIIKDAQGVLRNTNLANAMIDHNKVYPDLYDDVKRYVPPFYRLTSMSAAPSADGATATVTLVGTLDTFQQYNDLALALLRMPKVTSVSRSGFASIDPYKPGLTETDQTGTSRKPGETPVPDDQLERMAYFEATVKPDGYLNVGNFGSESTQARGAMPDSSLVTMRLVIARDVRTPNPRATLASAGGSAATPGAATPAAAPAAPAAAPAASSSKAAAGDDAGDDENLGKKGKK